ncbi:glycosyltransferase [Caldovatus aquaticus]|uniref:Glycosyltransferase n=1 Tax=Caldovatus aquaticus TaxID=2865671 RepID=A0ABS7F1H3_9PROT|nr:glycosyltransferase [Caldovatus aquaticus]MBW8268656.1 glycosyltransferase [Caldovatus aquaticus]
MPDAAGLAAALAASGMRSAAIAAWRAALAERPEDWRARLALGACLAAAGDLAAALRACEEAAALAAGTPGAAEAEERLAEALDALGERGPAAAALARARAARTAAGAPPPAVAPEAAAGREGAADARFVFDASDLFAYFADNRAPTGIQRVQLNVIAHALLDAPAGEPVAVAAFDQQHGAWRAVAPALFLRLWRLSQCGADPHDFAWQAALAELRGALAEGAALAFAPGAVLCNLGTSWWIRDYFLRVRDAKARFGLRYVPFVHDCIPLIVPQHCSAGLVREFAQWFASLALHADALLCNSRCTLVDVRRELAALLPAAELPATVVPLDADPRPALGAEASGAAGADADPRLPAPGEPFVLFVGTIESRKDHLLAFRAWRRLIARHGTAAVPRLLCVGKPGWLAEPALALLAEAQELAHRVSIVHGVPDSTLAALYRRCLFTLYNSHYEGWGLPVTESLAFGRVPLVPRHSSLPEAGGEGAVYFAPGDLDDLVSKLEVLLFDAAARQAAEARLARRVRLRDWRAVKDQILAALRAVPAKEEAAALAEARARQVALRPGRVLALRLAGETMPSVDMALADMARVGLGWHPLEPWGVWTRPGRAQLRLPLEAPTAAPMRLQLDCVAPPEDLTVRVRLGPGGPERRLLAPAGLRFTLTLEAPPGLAAVDLEIDSDEPGAALPDGRRVGLGLAALLLCRPYDLPARIAFLEQRRLPCRP